MHEIDVMIVNIYLLAIFTTLIKAKTTINIYRLLKFFVVGFFIVLVLMLFSYPQDQYNLPLTMIKLLPLLVLMMIIVQTEMRLLSKRLGMRWGLLHANTIEEDMKIELVKSVDFLSNRKIGALITLERAVNMDDFIATGFPIQSPINAELLSTIFMPNTPLHDGAVIIKGNRIVSAGCYFPPSENTDIPKHLGSRHRAGIGISEITDSLTIVVSEQTGFISIAVDGHLDQDISKESLILYLEKYLQN